MVNEEHAEVFRKGPEAIRAWFEAHPGEIFDLSGANLSEADLSDLDLFRTDTGGARMSGATILEDQFANLSEKQQQQFRERGVRVLGLSFNAELTRRLDLIDEKHAELEGQLSRIAGSWESASEKAKAEHAENFEHLAKIEAENATRFTNYAKLETKNARMLEALESAKTMSVEAFEVFDEKLSDLKGRLDVIPSIEERLVAKHKEVIALVKKLEEDIGEREVRSYIRVFEASAKENAKLSRGWLIASGVVVAVFIVLIIIFLVWPIDSEATSSSIASSILSRVTAIGALTTVLVFCLRNYSAARHSQTLNVHRANVMTAQEGFILSAGEEHRGEVIVETVKTAFSLMSTGFERSGGKSSGTPIVANILKSVTGKSGTA